MLRNSLRTRLLAVGGMTLVLALAGAGLGLEILFERHVERRSIKELKTDIRQLMAGLNVDELGEVTLTRIPGDQRYQQPRSGLYWQIKSTEGLNKRSRSLWDEELKLPADDMPHKGYHVHLIPGINANKTLLVLERGLIVKRGQQQFSYRLAAAMDRSETTRAVASFRIDLILALALLGFCLMVALWMAINVGLSPLQKLRASLGQLREGEARRLSGDFPAEVAPLAADLNELLDRQEASIESARARAADLAHGLKTPLTAISMLAEEMRERGDISNSEELADNAASMRRHVERELVLARASSSTLRKSDICNLYDIMMQMIRIMHRLPHGDKLHWKIEIDRQISLHVDEVVLREILGNLLDNARKWAQSTIHVSAETVGQFQSISIIDDGPGVPPEKLNDILQRGGRLDRHRDSTGLGLTIVRDSMAELDGRFEVFSPPFNRSNGFAAVVAFRRGKKKLHVRKAAPGSIPSDKLVDQSSS